MVNNMYTISDNKIAEFFDSYDNNNANVTPVGNIGAINNSISEYINTKISDGYLKEHCPEALDGHNLGRWHLNDKSHFYLKPINCCLLNPTDIITKGLISTNGVRSSPPKHLSSFLSILYQAMEGITNHSSGGVGCGMFSLACAYYANKENLGFDEIKQNVQSFIFNCNQTSGSRGSSSMFSSINLDLDYYDWMDNLPIDFSGLEYYNDLVIKAVTEVAHEGSGTKSVLLFPNIIYNINKDTDLSKHPEIFELVTKWHTPYFNRVDAIDGIEYKGLMGCRTFTPANWTFDPIKDSFSTGNAVYSTLSLPFAAAEAKESGVDLLVHIKKQFDILRKYSLLRYDRIIELSNQGYFSYHDQFYDIENATIVIGIVGLAECLEIYYDVLLESDEGFKLAKDLLSELEKYIEVFKNEDNRRWGLFSPPSENAAGRLARLANKRFGKAFAKTKGTIESPFYTNGVNLPVSSRVDLVQRIKIESELSGYTKAGNIIALNLGESYSDGSSLLSLTDKCKSSPFMAYSGIYSICDDCFTKYNTEIWTCPNCGGDTMVYSRVCGYVTSKSRWNKSKLSEGKERYYYNVEPQIGD
jgi:ribonucleoside-triphosphate reductase